MQVWIGRNGERFGPYADGEVRQGLRDGTWRPEELGWHEGTTDWRPLGELFPDDRPAPGAVPPPPPPPFMGIHESAVVPEYAGFWLRFGAWVIDYIILMIPLTIIGMTMGLTTAMVQFAEQMKTDQAGAFEAYAAALQPFTYVSIVVGFIYYTVFEASRWQATPGKMAVSIRVTGTDGQRISLARSAGRNVVRLTNVLRIVVPLPLICYVVAAFTQRKQGIHDLLASTYVLTGRADKAAAPAPRGGAGGTLDA
ncbi:MAG: RDD family protein [Luteibacter sp.]